MNGKHVMHLGLLCGAAVTLPMVVFAPLAQAQSFPPVNTPQVRQVVDDYGVNLSDGSLDIGSVQNENPVATIGGDDGLAYDRIEYNWRHKYTINIVTGTLNGQQIYRVQIGKIRRDFKLVGSVFEPLDGLPGTLNASVTEYVDANGVKYQFINATGYWLGEFLYRLGNNIILPNGRTENFDYYIKRYTYGSSQGGTFYDVPQLRSVRSNSGYQLKFEYDQSPYSLGASLTPLNVTALNNAVEYCDPLAETCVLTGSWPKLSDYPERRAQVSSTATSISVKRPGETQPGIVAQLDSSKRVSTLTVAGTYTRNYAWTPGVGTMTSVASDALGRTNTTLVDTAQNVVKSQTNPLGQTTTYTYDTKGRVTEIVVPDGQRVQYTYDARGNLTTTTRIAKSGSGLANIVTSAVYPATCVSPASCNKPTSIADARGMATDYSYDNIHGGVLTESAPADVSGVRPKTTFGYQAVYSKAKNSAGTLVDSTTPITRIDTVRACRSSAACVGGTDERLVDYTYDPATVPNGQLVSITTSLGNGSLASTTAYTYTALGQIASIDGPVSGNADTTVIRYDGVGRVTGVILPDPDGTGGPLPLPAVRRTYDNFDQVTGLETGTVTGTTQTAWDGFSPTTKSVASYDGFGRQLSTAQIATSGTDQYSVTQYSYDGANRPDCVAQRMNAPLTTTILPSSACTIMVAGANDPDRIAKNIYNAADQLVESRSGVGTTLQQPTRVITYSPNGHVTSLKDAKGNKTDLSYDGHDRLVKTLFPSLTIAGSSSSTDFEEITRDTAGNILTFRNRAGEVTTFTYDNLGRVTLKDAPGVEPDTYFAYDLFGNLTNARFGSLAGSGMAYTFNALGQITAAQNTMHGANRTLSYGYDAAGRRSSLDYPDGERITYDYDNLGRNTGLRRNGGTLLISNTFLANGLTNKVDPDGAALTTSYTFDAAGRLSRLDLGSTGNPNNVAWDFTYNPAGQLVSEARDNDAYAWTGHVTVDRPYTSNALNQYAAAGSSSFCYDGKGNLAYDGSYVYKYDSENRLREKRGVVNAICGSLDYSGPLQASLDYDPLGRLSLADTGSVKTMLYDADALVGEYDTASNLIDRYVHGLSEGDRPLVWYPGASMADSNARYLHSDRLGSIVAISSNTGSLVGRNTYDEHGIPGNGNLGRFQYTGQIWLDGLRMHYYKARMYSPTLGRFMQTDPIGYADGMNLYRYVSNDPVNRVDPTGLDDEIVVTGTRPSDPCRLIGYICNGTYNGSANFDNSAVPGPGAFLGASERNAQYGSRALNPIQSLQSGQKKVDCNSGARQLAKLGSATATGAGAATVAFAAVGAEPAAAFTGAIMLGADVVTLGAGLYIWYSEGDSSVVKSSAIGAAAGAAGGVLVRGFGGSITRGAGGVLIDKRPSNAAIEAGKYASGNGGQNLVNGICP